MNQKLVYQYNDAGEYCGVTEADESPLEPGVYHLPRNTTAVKPPDKWPETKWPRFEGKRWKLINRPVPANDNDPVAKLSAFLAANPDVAELISNKGGV